MLLIGQGTWADDLDAPTAPHINPITLAATIMALLAGIAITLALVEVLA